MADKKNIRFPDGVEELSELTADTPILVANPDTGEIEKISAQSIADLSGSMIAVNSEDIFNQ